METYQKIVVGLFLVAGGLLLFQKSGLRQKPEGEVSSPELEKTSEKQREMKIQSSAFENNGSIPSKYTCDGEEVNPPLEIKGIPAETESLALVVDDPDAPADTWTHWTVWNMGSGTERVEEDSVPPSGVEGKTDFGEPGYGGPCPPGGSHRYRFRIYALDSRLSLDSSAGRKELEEAMEDRIFDQALLTGIYERQDD